MGIHSPPLNPLKQGFELQGVHRIVSFFIHPIELNVHDYAADYTHIHYLCLFHKLFSPRMFYAVEGGTRLTKYLRGGTLGEQC